MKKIILILLMAFCVSSLNANSEQTAKVALWSGCMSRIKNPVFCEIIVVQFVCKAVVNDKITACHEKYKDPKICDKMEYEEWRKCKDFKF